MTIRISTKIFLLTFCLFISISVVFAAPAARAQMRNIRGAVKIFVANQNNWVVAAPRTHVELQAGDRVRTGQDGSADILIDGATLKITSRSEIVIPQAPAMSAGKQRAPMVKVIIGKIYVWIIGARRLELSAEGAGAYAKGTRFLFDVASDGLVTISVSEGSVEFFNEQGTTLVAANEQSQARRGMAPTTPVKIDPSQFFIWEASLERASFVDDAQGPAGVALAKYVVSSATEREVQIAALESLIATKPSAEAYLTMGTLQARSGLAAEATLSLNQAIAFNPSQAQAYALLSAVELSQGRVVEAEKAAQEAVRFAPDSAQAHESQARVLFFNGQLDEAENSVDTALELNPASSNAYLLVSDIAVARGDLNEGLRQAQAAVTLDPTNGPAFSSLGTLFLAFSDLPHAEKAFATALAADPNLAAARTGLGQTMARQGKFALALNQQQAAITLEPGMGRNHNNHGAALLALGRLDEAEAEFKTAINLLPQDGLAWCNLAILRLEQNRFAEAIEAAEQAIALGENSARCWATLARCYLEQNRTTQAWAAVRQALEIDRDFPLANFHLAEVLQSQGRTREALNRQLTAIAANPSAMLENRDYARTEVTVAAGSLAGQFKTEGRSDEGAMSWYLAGSAQDDDWERPHSDFNNATALAIAGYQPEVRQTVAGMLQLSHESSERPGRALADGSSADLDDESNFNAWQGLIFGRHPFGDNADWTWKAGYSRVTQVELNPDALTGDDRQFRRLQIADSGPLAELMLDKRAQRSHLTLGAAFAGESREISGVLAKRDYLGTVTTEDFDDEVNRDAGTAYGEFEYQLGADTRVMVGGRLAARRGMTPVTRLKAWVRHDMGSGSLVLLTQPLMRDDVSELAPVDYWAFTSGLSPYDFATGGYAQSWQVQYELMPSTNWVWRIGAFRNDLKNYLVELEDPAWSTGIAAEVVGIGTIQGLESEFETWLGSGFSLGLVGRLNDSSNDDLSDMEIPYVPQFLLDARLDYLNRSGWRIGLNWQHQGTRYADLNNTVELDAFSTLNLVVQKQCGIHLNTFVRCDNLLDEEDGFYQDYPSRGRTFKAGVEVRF